MFEPQTIVAWLIILAAAAYMFRRGYRRFKKGGGGNGCGSCVNANTQLKIRPLTQIAPPTKLKEFDD